MQNKKKNLNRGTISNKERTNHIVQKKMGKDEQGLGSASAIMMLTPIAGWFISWKILLKWMMNRGTPTSGMTHI